jgi:hypothetical protein
VSRNEPHVHQSACVSCGCRYESHPNPECDHYTTGDRLVMAYADPPYPGQSKRHYADHPDYAGEVDHRELVARLVGDYPDGWALSTSSTALRYVLDLCPEDARVAAWVKPFAAFKNQRITMAWEPVIYRARGGAAEHVGHLVRDWIAVAPQVFRGGDRTGVPGTKPKEFCYWLFHLLGLGPTDELHDLFPGSGAVSEAWDAWRAQGTLAA